MEEECFYTPMHRHRASDAESTEQEVFLTPAYRHGPSNRAEELFLTPLGNGDRAAEDDDDDENGGGGLDGEDGKEVRVELNDAEVDSVITDDGEECGFVNGEHHRMILVGKIGNGKITEKHVAEIEEACESGKYGGMVSNGQSGIGEIVEAASDGVKPKGESENGEHRGMVSDGRIGIGKAVEAANDIAESKEVVEAASVGVSENGEYHGFVLDGPIGIGELVEAANDVTESDEVSENEEYRGMVPDGRIGIGKVVEAANDVAESKEVSENGEYSEMDSDGRSGIGEIVEAASDDVSENGEHHGLVLDGPIEIGELVEAANDVTESDEVSENEEYRGMVSDGQIGIGKVVEAAKAESEEVSENGEYSGMDSDGRSGIGEIVEAASDGVSKNGEYHGLVLDGSIGIGELVEAANDVTESEEVSENEEYRGMVLDGQNGIGESKEVSENGEYHGMVLDEQRGIGEIVDDAYDLSESKEEVASEQGVREVLDCRGNMLSEAVSRSQTTDTTISRSQITGTPSLPARPAGLGPSALLLETAPRPIQHPKVNGAVPQRVSELQEDPANDDPEDNDETRKKLQDIRVKFLRLARRLGQTPHNVVVAQVLYRLGLAEQLSRNTNRPGVFSFDRASVMAEQLEAAGEDLNDFTCTIMVIGKSGVGKSATINSILDEDTKKVRTDAFQSGTNKVQVINGKVQGVKVRVIDTPGLFTCSSDQHRNAKNLNSVKKLISKNAPDIVLYFDRLDMQSRDNGDLLLLRTVTDIFGPSVWFNAIVVLTHAASPPPDGPNGIPLSYDTFVTQRSHVVQQAIHAAAGDVRLMNPVSLVENHSACRTNRNGQRVLPNGQVWKPQLLLLSFASKILAEANMLLKLQDSPAGRPFGAGTRIPPLPFFLSPLLQSRPQLKLPDDQSADDLDGTSDADDGSDYDDLPPFKNLTRSQLAKLTKAQKKSYFEELEYREKLFLKKQLKEERKHRKLMKNIAEAAKDLTNNNNGDSIDDESSSPASVPVPLPDLVLPASFDSDNPTHRYRFLDTSSQWVVRPVLETQGWDHDIGYEGLNLERLFVVKDSIPVSVSGQLTKDKKESTLQMEFAGSIKHGEVGATSMSLDVQTLGKETAYTFRGETRVRNFRRNNTTAGVSVSLLGDAASVGAKIEDKLVVSKRLRFLVSGGAMAGRGDVAYGGRLEATLRDEDYPIGRSLSTLALSVMDWRGDLAVGCNVQSQLPLGRGTNVVGHVNLSNRGTGQVGVRLNSSDQLQIALFALLPVFRNLKRILFDSPDCM